MITIGAYLMGRAEKYPDALTDELMANGMDTVRKVNELLAEAQTFGIFQPIKSETGSQVSSGWRPPAVNARVPGAARRSLHMTMQACDIYDPENALDDWCMKHLDVLERIGLWLESPTATPGWCHVQTKPPGSRRRVFIP